MEQVLGYMWVLLPEIDEDERAIWTGLLPRVDH